MKKFKNYFIKLVGNVVRLLIIAPFIVKDYRYLCIDNFQWKLYKTRTGSDNVF